MLRVLICDDSRISLDINKVYVEEFAKKRNVPVRIEEFTNITSDVEHTIQSERIDIAILDIDFNKSSSGLGLGKKILKYQPHAVVIYITNFVEYALEAYKMIPFGFLKKPVSEEIFEKLFVRALIQINGLVATRNNNNIEIVANGTRQIIKESSIYYIEKSGHKAEIFTKTGEYSAYGSLKYLEEKLSAVFLKINKGIVINMNQVLEVTNRTVTLKNGCELPISQRKLKLVQEEINKHLNLLY